MKDNRLRELEPGYARCVWYVMYQLLPTQLTVLCTKTWANFHHFSFENLTQKMHRLFQTRYSSFAFNWAVLLTNFCYIVLLQMFSIDWALKDISITVKVETGQIDNVYSREFSVQILPHYTKSLQIQKALELTQLWNHTFSSGVYTTPAGSWIFLWVYSHWKQKFTVVLPFISLLCAFDFNETKPAEEREWEYEKYVIVRVSLPACKCGLKICTKIPYFPLFFFYYFL